MPTDSLDSRALRALLAAASLLVVVACSGGAGDGRSAGSGRPDLSLVENRLAENAKVLTEGMARLVELKETRCEKTEEMAGAANWNVRVEGVMEIDGPCYYLNQERSKGDRVRFEYTTNVIRDAQGRWIQEPGRIDPL